MAGAPLDALKRFAQDVKNEDPDYLALNLGRVSEFITKAELDVDARRQESSAALARKLEDRNRKVGVYQYPSPREHAKSLALLQNVPESSPLLGARSRFGDGDGSFFDRFVASDMNLEELTDHKQLRLGGEVQRPDLGFRRQLAAARSGLERAPEPTTRIKPYAERRRERLEREEAVKARAGTASSGVEETTKEQEGEKLPALPSSARRAVSPLPRSAPHPPTPSSSTSSSSSASAEHQPFGWEGEKGSAFLSLPPCPPPSQTKRGRPTSAPRAAMRSSGFTSSFLGSAR